MKYTSLTHYANANIQQDWMTEDDWLAYMRNDDAVIWSALLDAENGDLINMYVEDK